MPKLAEVVAALVIAVMMLGPLSMAPHYAAPEQAQGSAPTPTGAPNDKAPLSAAKE